MDVSCYVNDSEMCNNNVELQLNYAGATPQGMIESCKREIKTLEKQIGKCYSYAIELFDLDSTEVEDEEYIINSG